MRSSTSWSSHGADLFGRRTHDVVGPTSSVADRFGTHARWFGGDSVAIVLSSTASTRVRRREARDVRSEPRTRPGTRAGPGPGDTQSQVGRRAPGHTSTRRIAVDLSPPAPLSILLPSHHATSRSALGAPRLVSLSGRSESGSAGRPGDDADACPVLGQRPRPVGLTGVDRGAAASRRASRSEPGRSHSCRRARSWSASNES